ncbi:helix-turn-helix transcriptional regulator [Saccharospirillum impatiens]|uniref:helix-turn-helix transcriptional regulator n=1 Tax=Saccharospirillum impatiens TaxID=169438 RepID=UPI0003F7D20C|nr:LuxR C-terminal-related transcriptional regulator [Saccharospirillum impatiens]
MSPTADQLRTFSRCILNLPDPAETTDPQDWLSEAVAALQPLVKFDSAWWGQVEADHAAGVARNVMHGSHGLSPRFALEWNAISCSDDFARASINRLGEAIVLNHSEDLAESTDVTHFALKHGLHHCMAVTLRFRASGLLFFISLYRNHTGPDFTPMEALWLEEFSTHLLDGWVHCLALANQGRFRDHWDSAALTNAAGRILYIGKELSHLLDDQFEDWQGTEMPDALVRSLTTKRRSPYRRDRTGLLVQPFGKLASFTLCRDAYRMPPPRELSAALLYAKGQSYKEVARSLGVTPATVRTYLRQVYSQLNVNNKMALATALHKAGYDTGSAPAPTPGPLAREPADTA